MERARVGLSMLIALASACGGSATTPAPVVEAPRGHVERAPVVPVMTAAFAVPPPPSASGDVAPPPTPVAKDDGPRVTSVGQTSWIYKHPEATEANYLGYIRSGTSVRVRSLETTPGVGCAGGFYETLPRGFLCNDHTVSTSPPIEYMRVIRETRAREGVMPYRYALSDGAPMYNRVPTVEEIASTERFQGKPHAFSALFPTLRAHEELAVVDPIAASDPLPAFLEGGGATRAAPFDLVERTIPRGSMLSFQASFEANGRVYLLSTDHTLVPADRVRIYRPTAFHGTAIGEGGAKLPIAWIREKPRVVYERAEGVDASATTVAESAIVATDEAWKTQSFTELTGLKIDAGGRRFLETRTEGARGTRLLLESDATIVEAAKERPFGVKEGQKWVIVSISKGTLVAYEDLVPVYATLVSPGAGGVPIEGHNPVKDATTPIGTFTITFKDRASTMSPDKGSDRTFWIADVPYTQYFDAPFALHGAFWHERFGMPASAGCVNLAPIDAKALFAWTDPPVPDEWQGATGAGASENGPSTEVVIRR